MIISELRGLGAPRIDDVQPRPPSHRFEHVVKKDGMGLAGVGSPQEDDVRIFHLAVGAGAPARAEYCRQTDDTRSVSSPVAAVDVVGADGGADSGAEGTADGGANPGGHDGGADGSAGGDGGADSGAGV